MSAKSLFRVGGWCALLSILLVVPGIVASEVAPNSGIFETVCIVDELLMVSVFYALFVLHRSESAGLSLAGLVLWIPGFIVGVASRLNPGSAYLDAANSLASALPFLIFGYLAYRSPKMPRGLAWMALLSGAFRWVAASAEFAGSGAMDALAGLGVLVFGSVWCVWLWRLLTSGNLDLDAASSPGSDPALQPSPPAPSRR